MGAIVQAPDIAERAVLASVLMDPPCIAAIADRVLPDDFADLDYRHTFAAMLACHSRGQRPDLVTVADELTSNGQERLATEVYLIVSESGPFVTSANVETYAARVVNHSRRRTVVSKATALIQALHEQPEADPVELAHQALHEIGLLSATDAGPLLYADVMESFQERLTLQMAGEWEERLFRTGLHDLDRKLGGGFRDGELITLAARPGVGKTAISLQMIQNGGRRNEPVLFFSAEMSMPSLVERAMSEMTGISMQDIRQKNMPQDRYDALMRTSEVMARMPVAIDDSSGLTVSQMLIRAQRFQRKHGLRAVFFDYLELAGDTSKQGDTHRLSEISRGMKHMAKSCNVPVVELSQLNREVENRTPPIPRMADIRQSGAIEANSDIVLMLYREDYYVAQGQIKEPTGDKFGIADIFITKQRNGPSGTVSVRFDETSMRFTNLDDPIDIVPRKAS